MNNREFARRRRQLMRMMGADSIAILPTALEKIRNRDVEYPFRPDSDFYYLTGFAEPEAVMVLVPGRRHAEYILFCRERDPQKETWTGRRAGPEGACRDYAADDAFPIGDIDEILPGLIEGRERVYYTVGVQPEFDSHVINWVNQIRDNARSGQRTPGEFISLEHLLHDMRLYKSVVEQRAMRRSARISAAAHINAMQNCEPGMMEYEIEAEFTYEFRRHGCHHAYSPIVAGGDNACILHYTSNDAVLNDGDLLLIDAGAEHDLYASDITRTFPVNGVFSKAQRAIYDLVLAAQQAAIRKVQAGNHWNEPHDAAVRVLTRGLVKLGILKGQPAKLVKSGVYRRFYMHRTGHWLGMDVHDVGDYKVGDEWRVLEPGMVLTVEPGLYIPEGSKGVAKKWWGIGVRIEDDVLVTRDGNEILSRDVPSDPDEIETLMSWEE